MLSPKQEDQATSLVGNKNSTLSKCTAITAVASFEKIARINAGSDGLNWLRMLVSGNLLGSVAKLNLQQAAHLAAASSVPCELTCGTGRSAENRPAYAGISSISEAGKTIPWQNNVCLSRWEPHFVVNCDMAELSDASSGQTTCAIKVKHTGHFYSFPPKPKMANFVCPRPPDIPTQLPKVGSMSGFPPSFSQLRKVASKAALLAQRDVG